MRTEIRGEMRAASLRRLLPAAIAALAVVPASAAGPFQVLRADSARAVAAAPPAATVARAPFDDGPEFFADGTSHWYAVYDASGAAVDISVQRNSVTGGLRIGFDDGNPASAPVDPTLSTVSLSTASVRADGLQVATITVVPKDASGVPLGRGLALAIDAAMLWPLGPTGPIADMGDGSYRVTVVASTPGSGTVWIAVEGTVLAATPSIVATAVDTSGSPRDLAVAELSGLSSPSGPIQALVAQSGSGTPQAAALSSALSGAAAAASSLANGDWKRDDNVLKSDLDAVVGDLAGVLSNPGRVNPAAVLQVMDALVGAARLVAVAHVGAAEAKCGSCGADGQPRRACDAESALGSADALRDAAPPDWSAILDGYGWAVELGLQAERSC